MRRLPLFVGMLLAAAVTAQAADPRDPLSRARSLYNQRQYEAAIEAADEARKLPDRAASADLIAARAYLERFRLSQSPDDLTGARARLRRIEGSKFTPTERFEFLIGVGETLYLDDASGAAAVVFESVLFGQGDAGVEARERLLDWWASALDRDARPRPEIDRQPIYQRIRERMMVELSNNPASSTASYWIAAAARGQGDLQAAWDAAQAAWVRAVLAPGGGTGLRNDLDQLVQRAIVPERSRILAQPPDALLAEWEAFKEKWTSTGP
jgi:hypothetical protein